MKSLMTIVLSAGLVVSSGAVAQANEALADNLLSTLWFDSGG